MVENSVIVYKKSGINSFYAQPSEMKPLTFPTGDPDRDTMLENPPEQTILGRADT